MASLIGLQCVGGKSPYYEKTSLDIWNPGAGTDKGSKHFSCFNCMDTGYTIYYGDGPKNEPCYCGIIKQEVYKNDIGLKLEDYIFEKNTEETRENVKRTIENYLKSISSLVYKVEVTSSPDDPTILNCNIVPYRSHIEMNITLTKDDVIFSSSDSWCDICDEPIEYCECE